MGKLKLKPGVPMVIVGGAWGDEGKGKLVDILSEQADLVIRANGGANAGHSVEVDGKKYDFHLIPSGVLYPKVLNILGSGVAFNPIYFQEELKKLQEKGMDPKNILISEKANLVLPFHIYLDELEEKIKAKTGSSVGTTKQGIGPANTDMMRRISLRAYHLTNRELFLKDLKFALGIHRSYIKSDKVFKLEYYEPLINSWVKFFKGRITDTEKIVREAIRKKKKIVVEGAQGALLDLRHGTYPNVTTSWTGVSGTCQDAGISVGVKIESVGVFKAYFSRVGSGGMPTELKNDLSQVIRDKAHEYGVTTGRPRRIGFFDGVAAAYSQEINRFDFLVISCADVICNLDPKLGLLKICKGYSGGWGGKKFVWVDTLLEGCVPIYGQNFSSPKVDFKKVKEWSDFPKDLQKYLRAIEASVPGAKLLAVGIGPGRDEMIVL